MLNPVESALNVYAAQMRASKEWINALLSSTQRIDHIILQTVKDELNSQLTSAGALATATDPFGAAASKDAFAHANRERALSCYREIFESLADAYIGTARIFDRYVKDLSRCATDPTQDLKSDAQTPGTIFPVEDMLDFWNTGWKQWNSLTGQYREAMTAGRGSGPAPSAELISAPKSGEKRQEARSRRH